jgi:hypothetical protein
MFIKSITLLNANRIPFFHKTDTPFPSLPAEAFTDSSILVTNNTYCYRVGVFGWLFKMLSNQMCTKSTFLVNKINEYRNTKSKFECSDLQLLTFGVSYVNSYIPILNLFTVNERYKCTTNFKFKYGYYNNSLPSIFSCCYNPYFDSGCSILSNFKPLYTNFIPLRWKNKEYLDDLVNKGILYNFYKNGDESCLIVTFNFAENKTIDELLFDIDDVMTWLSKLQFENEEKFPIFIIGDFKMFINEDNNVMKLIIGQNFNLKHLGNTSYVIHNIQNEEINVIEQPEYDTIKIVFCRNESPVESETVNIIFNSNDLEEFEEKNKTTTSPQNIIGETQVLENYYNKSPKSNSSNDSWTLV